MILGIIRAFSLARSLALDLARFPTRLFHKKREKPTSLQIRDDSGQGANEINIEAVKEVQAPGVSQVGLSETLDLEEIKRAGFGIPHEYFFYGNPLFSVLERRLLLHMQLLRFCTTLVAAAAKVLQIATCLGQKMCNSSRLALAAARVPVTTKSLIL